MKVKWNFIKRFHLDQTYGLLSARSAFLAWEMFKLMDWRGTGSLDDIQFATFMSYATDLKERQIYKVFDIFDLDRSGSVEFDEFYVLMTILVAIKDDQGKQFMYQHWRTCFEILDEDGGKSVSITEFSTLGFLFNFSPGAIKKIYNEFDVAGNQELDYSEFRLFVLAAIEMQDTMNKEGDSYGAKLLDYARRFLNMISFSTPATGAVKIEDTKEKDMLSSRTTIDTKNTISRRNTTGTLKNFGNDLQEVKIISSRDSEYNE